MRDDVNWLDYYEAGKDDKEYIEQQQKAEAARSSFSTVMESYNGFVTVKGYRMDIDEQTRIQDVLDFLDAEGQTVVVDNLNTSLTFFSGCYLSEDGYYHMRTDIDWHNYYEK